ncbi:MAG: PaaI family thioesterase [Candidatus Cloacimonetes bacterium]|nr:PaaI family thioesterase [Candidatus Cloacimonadota bacterium]
MREILNPYKKYDGYNCFGCAPNNECGLQLTFFEDEDEIVSFWEPKDFFQGYLDVLHGGIQSALIDEIGSWVVLIKGRTAGVTSKLEVKYKKAAYVNRGTITLRAKMHQIRRNLYTVYVRLLDADDTLCAEGYVTYFTFSKKRASKDFYFPEYEEFFKD